MNGDLQTLRGEIDTIDRQMVALFEKRMACARGVAAYKLAHDMPVLDASREEQVLASRAAMLEDPALAAPLQALYRHIMALSSDSQREILREAGPQAVAYSGVPGAYAEEALIGYFGEAAERLPCRGFAQVFSAVAEGRARYGVVPLENSSAGSVFDVYDLLGKYDLRIVGEQLVHVRHCLLGLPGARIEGITRVYSHAQGLMQCAEYLDAHPDWERAAQYNTAGSAQRVRDEGEARYAAIASRLAARCYGLEVLQADIHSFDQNYTRFVVVAGANEPFVPDADKATLTFTLRHERGTLHRALACFVALGMNLTRIESRPIPQMNWEYRFYVDVEGKVGDRYMNVLRESLLADCVDCRLLGIYRAARGMRHA